MKLDICALREYYEAGDLVDVIWVSKDELADGLTKLTREGKSLRQILNNELFPEHATAAFKKSKTGQRRHVNVLDQ